MRVYSIYMYFNNDITLRPKKQGNKVQDISIVALLNTNLKEFRVLKAK